VHNSEVKEKKSGAFPFEAGTTSKNKFLTRFPTKRGGI